MFVPSGSGALRMRGKWIRPLMSERVKCDSSTISRAFVIGGAGKGVP